ncbi:hypothetical protein DPSP01_003033 [Paraphaeosphaeria sporulosa]|uniref:Uncharacterized protein n=1 Tax=Paraphaeosphaeria sporulosa TaxID=1460663 RepID=A0A177CML4_9PLEO|nr:uncharacterized protein CC84DRAFT_1214644 [Paraphaeosphaeria sporulosa]OAG08110.1 hypothetical protein CC84DRAFT_1214644 [Paraphaeosphaeria sporulosa]
MAAKKYQPLTLTPINFSLTEGTSIPAPVDTPPETPHQPAPGKGPLSSHPTPKSAVFPHHEATPPAKESSETAEPNLHQTATNDGASTMSPSSPSSRRPSSVRKFLGLRPLSSHDSLKSERPGSPATIASQPSLSRKKSGSWFGKNKRQSSFIIGSLPEGKESTTNYQANGAKSPPVKKGPPPPALPDLKSFGVSSDLGADDMFKGIN